MDAISDSASCNSCENGFPRFSVITIVKDGCQFIGETIDSVLGQSYKEVEYIVVDGGSIDGTVGIINSYGSRINKFVSEKDNGISDAFNKGLMRATGDYVLFLNSDDALAGPDVLSEVAQEITRSGCPVLVYGDCDVLERSSAKVLYRAVVAISYRGLMKGRMLPHPSLFTHISYFRKYGVFDGEFKIAMDYEWLLRCGLKESLSHMPLLVTRVRCGGISTLDQKKVVNEIILALKKNKYIKSRLGETGLRIYFSGRSLAKIILSSIGLYKLFSSVRNKISS